MNGLAAQLAEAQAVRDALAKSPTLRVDVMICPPATLLAQMAWAVKGSNILLGGQDCHAEASGAYTGDIAAEMLADAGATAVIVGHSERRAAHGELDSIVRAKAAAAHRAGLTAIVCVGETAGERAAGLTEDRGAPPAGRLAAGCSDGGQHRRRLRAGVGDRHRADADGRGRGARARGDPRRH